MAFELHYHPGYFSEGVKRLFLKLESGATLFRMRDAKASTEGVAYAGEALYDWLSSPNLGELRRATANFTADGGGPTFTGELITLGRSAERSIAIVSWPESIQVGGTDVELGFMGLGCAALAVEAQGAAILGRDLGRTVPSAECGSIADEVLEKVAQRNQGILLFLTTADTARSLGEVAGYSSAPLANLFEYRRFNP